MSRPPEALVSGDLRRCVHIAGWFTFLLFVHVLLHPELSLLNRQFHQHARHQGIHRLLSHRQLTSIHSP
jgi:hypothetical protein